MRRWTLHHLCVFLFQSENGEQKEKELSLELSRIREQVGEFFALFLIWALEMRLLRMYYNLYL